MHKKIAAALLLLFIVSCTAPLKVQKTQRSNDRSVSIIEKVADHELAVIKPHPDLWVETVLYSGMMSAYRVTGYQKYLDAVIAWGDSKKWREGPMGRHADDVSAGQVYLEAFFETKDPKMLEPIKKIYDEIAATPVRGREEWWWCDALFMSPPTLARLYKATNDIKYIDYLDDMWWDASEFLYDEEDHLFFRDKRFIPGVSDSLILEKNGNKVFWGRGNGWVLAGLARVLQHFPDDFPSKKRYIKQFREMAAAIIKHQGPDGLWRMSLLDQENHPNPESSGTGLICYALAWGINSGLLDKETFLEPVSRAWSGLVHAVHPSGKVGWVQRIGFAPDEVSYDDTELYGTGAFLLAAEEVIKLNIIELSAGEFFPSLASDGAWCWFADPRALYYKGAHDKTYLSWVNSKGDIQAAEYDFGNEVLATSTLRVGLDQDDHANPGMIIRPDGRIMIFYSGHNGRDMYYRISSTPEQVQAWEDEQILPTNTEGNSGYTYPNPVQLSAENNKIYLFFRGNNWQPNFSTSDDGKEWAPAKSLLSGGGLRPYMKMYSNGVDEIHFIYTDGHPRNEKLNSIYYVYYKNGVFYKRTGEKIAGINELPFDLKQGDKIYDASISGEKAWIWDIALDKGNKPVVAYVTFPDSLNHIYRYMKWDGEKWNSHQIVNAGKWFPQTSEGASETEPNYSGGLILNKQNTSELYLSREIEGVFEIERWNTPDAGATWKSEPVTAKSKVNNMRPYVPEGQLPGKVKVLWMNGYYIHYRNYNTAIKMN
ncbi:MAG: glycoside hydrolase family 88 protein [Ignavibacteriales bacterium]|nr:glycoside hydrolase family 88 protein [Ignavibacteriales bacterium]MCF8306699.1 glycoside hydrolase family 88 protein [Ignavibacteriales bacterium]MCF8316201.1 glycoside hydrolase family 88 protein [Ignavibacteriales bacterium]MCF8437785.1 glycoside hydrolase family 88 protein [Ignavibacteriales bacterium]